MKRSWATVIGILASASACSTSLSAAVSSCTSDDQCNPTESCFPEGCTDLGQDVVVELTGDPLAGQYARDVVVKKLGPILDFQLGGPLVVQGELSREGSSPAWYTQPVRIQALGSSDLIPGVWRSYEKRFDSPVRGLFEMSLGAGTFAMTATADDLSIPPAPDADGGVQVAQPRPFAHFTFPSADGALTVSGRLIATVDNSGLVAREIPITQAAVDLQAFSPDTRTQVPLSQRFPVSSGQPGSNGNFIMTLSPAAKELKSVLFRASPRSSGAPVPSKVFVVDTPIPSPLNLELGDFSTPVSVSGLVVGGDGAAIAQATVIIGGIVPGGGTFTSQIATSDGSGAFTLQTLPGQDELSLTVLPPPTSAWAIATRQLRVNGPVQGLVVSCGSRSEVGGVVTRPDGRPAVGTKVKASPVGTNAFGSRLLPLADAETTVGPDGSYVLQLDQSTWQLTFTTTDLPLTTRAISVTPTLTDGGWTFSLPQPPLKLRAGRVVSGNVVVTNGSASTPVAFAGVRFFRVAPVEGTVTSVLLGSAVADANGHYSVVLPTR